jgi:hypothetical protein
MAEELPGVGELLLELQALERQERDLSAIRRRLHDRIDGGFGNEIAITRERQVSAERRELHRRIDAVGAQLAPIMRRRDMA